MVDLNRQIDSHRYHRYFVDLGNFYKTKKSKVYTGIIISLLTIIFFIIFAIKPTLVTIAQLIRQVKDQKTVVTALEKKTNNLSQAQTNYLNIESRLFLVDEALPTTAEINSLVKQFEILSRKSGISIESFRINEATLNTSKSKKSQKQPVSFNLTISGNYESLKTFIDSLNDLRRIITVESFVFQVGRGEDDILALNINGQAWFLAK